MEKLAQRARQAAGWLLVLGVVGALAVLPRAVWAASGTGGGQPATPWPWEVVPGPALDSPAMFAASLPSELDPGPQVTAETWTNPVFWIVVGLVVLGSLVLMADFPENL